MDGANKNALERTLRCLPKDEADAARVELARSLADAVDRYPKNAQLWRVYRDAIESLYAHDDVANDDLQKALAEIAGAAPVRNPKKARAGDAGNKDRGGGKATRV